MALPPSRELRAELCSARYEPQINGIKLEDKDDIKKRLGRSPDYADAYVMANWRGESAFVGKLAQAMDRKPAPRLMDRMAPESGT